MSNYAEGEAKQILSTSWTCYYWTDVWCGDGEHTELIVPCTEEEHAILEKLSYIEDNCTVYVESVDEITEDDIQELKEFITEDDCPIKSLEEVINLIDKTVETVDELEGFVSRVEEEANKAADKDLQMYGDMIIRESVHVGWNYGSVE